MDRRDSPKTLGAALALPVVAKLVPPESVKSAGPVVRTCAGTRDGMPTGWARFCDFRLHAPNLHSDGSLTGIGSVPDYYYGHPRDFLRASRLNQEQVAHALGE